RGLMDVYDTAVRDQFSLEHQRMSALASLVANPTWHEILSLDMQEAADGAVMDLVSTALGWTALASTMWPFCIDPPVTVAAETPPDPTVAPPRPCVGREWAHGITPSVKSPDFDVAGTPVSLSLQAKCEELK